jgi:hypothetical protein
LWVAARPHFESGWRWLAAGPQVLSDRVVIDRIITIGC